ncbi:hypothetical protein B484DRAFT_394415 [Ochromonadaceae sp. CCMP2298]|nr:hypothetical protein B484DRAFT_394415 [Ochromonadaceae sp. CCMP2298]
MEGKEEGEGTGAKGAGDRGDIGDRGDRGDRGYDRGTFVDEYAIPRRLNILRVLPCSPNRAVSVLDLVGRIHLQRDRFQEKYQRKAESEQQFFKEKYAVSVV